MREGTLIKYLPKYVKYLELRLIDSAKKDYYISQIGEFAYALGLKKRMVINIEDIADELIMNAIYHAPCNQNGNHKYTKLSRTERVILAVGEEATLECAYDGQCFGIAVADPFGSFRKEEIIKYLEKCVGVKDIKVNGKLEGAGLGFYKIFDVLDQLTIKVARGKDRSNRYN